jgi:hypothetical protein
VRGFEGSGKVVVWASGKEGQEGKVVVVEEED